MNHSDARFRADNIRLGFTSERPMAAGSASITITITNSNDLDRITVYSVYGEPINNTILPTSSPYAVTLTSGLYIVVGIHADAVICKRKNTVQ